MDRCNIFWHTTVAGESDIHLTLSAYAWYIRHAKRRYCTVWPDAFYRNRRNFCVWACFIKNLNEAFSISLKSIFNSVGHLTFALAPTHVQNIYPKSLFVPRKVRKMFLTQIWVLPTTQQNSEFFTHYFRVYNLES